MVKMKVTTLSLFGFLCIAQANVQGQSSSSFKDDLQTTLLQNLADENTQILKELDSIKFVNAGEKNVDNVVFDIQDVGMVRKLLSLQREVPLNYNAQVRNYIELYSSKNYKPHMSKMLGLGQYYFPIYEKIFKEMNVPDEIKYLSIVESALNPHSVSRVGATGPWQFMYGTAKSYNLIMDNYLDERKDPYASCYAAARYMQDSYQEFGDWLVAIASYNCGKGNIKRAIAKSGKTNPNFWEISAYLPRETRNYVPAFIAMTYMMGYAAENNIEAATTDYHLATDMMMVDKSLNLNSIAQALNLSEEALKMLNPGYKKGIVNGTAETPRRLVIPKLAGMDEEKLYTALNSPVETMAAVVEAVNDDLRVSPNAMTRHRVRKGETLQSISRKFGVSVQNLKAWNDISSSRAPVGRTLIVSSPGVNERLASRVSKSKAATTSKKSTSTYLSYTVKRGDTLSDIANKYKGATVSNIKADNGLSSSKLKPGMKLKIKK
ncbi:LysM peptidoglycan-binding domain-containing protein [Sphingobacterium spiritivorum]|uniref:LysM domain protein n=1 Tax=Sphingobacterium spiritivorum ATCC 33861 TaxID=525373 RepID=D7VNF7_SPHSI|nr:lytic transglycosylase domain-containing protein [Sphingobacterium spiritivorum]EFK57454.1 LysM domain protein [Sphingobacterium spiritivorum ATCC 33861]QQT36476.1 LysM peptidoglycan-binding domain-containing protein [Sphingobacterium spiritivorum]WQD33228.1 LysM peptidoglycan-binding domain-containing protein [Sphingobacterium spiritivorum]SUJ20341.1 Membrane-bound lytic murein transglycosylase D precursor [Sphingobacterium spiritivorum]